jgi:hypothetical protein
MVKQFPTLTDPYSYCLHAVISCLYFYSDNAMHISKRISWLACTVESKAYLREYDVEWVLGDGRTTVIVHQVTPTNLTH